MQNGAKRRTLGTFKNLIVKDNSVSVLGVKITKLPEEEVLEFIIRSLKNFEKKFYVVTPNPEILVMAYKDSTYKKVLNEAKLALPDGVGVIWAAKFLGKHLDDRFSGVDFMEKLCERLSKRIETVGFLGGMPGVAVKTAECLKKRYPGLNVVFADSEWHNRDYSKYILGEKKTIDVLFVAFGSPKQEKWIYNNLSYLPVKMAVGVGGAFDFISGRVPRAPLFVRKAGLEWLFRLTIQPWRIKRQLALLEFVFLVFKERIKNWQLHRREG